MQTVMQECKQAGKFGGQVITKCAAVHMGTTL